MVNNAQMIVTTWGDGFACSVSSPQLPGIVAAYDERPHAGDLFTLAVAAGLSPDGDIDVHLQRAIEIDSKQFFVRARQDFRGEERGRLATRICDELDQDPNLREYADADRYDDALIIATLSSDLIESVMSGVEEHQPLTIGMESSDGSAHYIGVVTSNGSTPGPRLSDLGLDSSSTIGQMFEKLGVGPSAHDHQHGRILVTV
ncbi:hypothetical protein GCM10027405_03250 [Arthrobacter alkaliphilus]|uniref:hypothetical protein n=1 Tax=Arthrobacter alkaliphilus TaxID=369936 RepID=UPI001F1E6801|nr:hypothetical protein [Arthrobacter alkaliphilus]